MNPPRTTVRRDGTVRLWDVYRQRLVEYAAPGVPPAILATLPPCDRERIAKAAARTGRRCLIGWAIYHSSTAGRPEAHGKTAGYAGEWHYQPAGYDGDVWSLGYRTRAQALAACLQEIERADEGGAP